VLGSEFDKQAFVEPQFSKVNVDQVVTVTSVAIGLFQAAADGSKIELGQIGSKLDSGFRERVFPRRTPAGTALCLGRFDAPILDHELIAIFRASRASGKENAEQ